MTSKTHLTRIITPLNEKGGVGKTCSTLNLGAALSLLGKKVLLIDFDPAAKLTKYCGVDPKRLDKSIYQVAIGQARPQDVVIHLPKFDLLPANRDLSGAIEDFVLMRERKGIFGEEILKIQLQEFMQDYDYVLIDTMPTYNKLETCALIASTEVFIVIEPEYFSVDGVSELLETISDVQSASNPALQITGAFVTKMHFGFGGHKGFSKYVKDSLGDIVFDTRIGTCREIADSTGNHKDIFDYKKSCRGARDYMALAQEIVKQERHP